MSKRFIVIACEILFREVCFCVSKSKNIVDVMFQKKALHDIGEAEMYRALQNAVNQVDHEKYDAILLAYGLCNNGIKNLHAPIPMVVPRAHDCIALLMGSKEKYADYFANNPGAYYHSSGWLERNAHDERSVMHQLGIAKTYDEYVDEYGEDNAEYLMSMLGNWLVNYTKVAFINNGIGDVENNRAKSKTIAHENNWDYEEVEGNISLIERLIEGEWVESDFLVIPPNCVIEPSHDSNIVTWTRG